MRISLIGTGRVAQHLATALAHHHHIVQIFGRNPARAQSLAQQVQAQAISDYNQLQAACDVLVVAVSDQAIAQVVAQVHAHVPDVLLVHTSGSTDMAVIHDTHARAGVFYPLQTFSMGHEVDWQHTPVLVEASLAADEALLLQLADTLSQRVYRYQSAQRLSLHLAAVFACNFTNLCYDAAEQIVAEQGVDFALLHPLMLETARKATQAQPQQVQTGPAARGDLGILAMHETMLQHANHGTWLPCYQLLSERIQQRQQQLEP